MRDLHTSLGLALDDVDPGRLPLHAIVRQGRLIKIRRRVAVALAAAVLTATAVATPALLHRFSVLSSPPVSPSHDRVTVYPPGPGAPTGLIARGIVDGVNWTITGSNSKADGLCFSWLRETDCSSGGPGPAHTSRSGNIITPVTSTGTFPLDAVWTVRSDVAYVLVSLADGQLLRLRPVAIFGPRHASYVAMAVPSSAAVTKVSAYSSRGEIAYAIPFTADQNITVSRWLRPGQLALPRPVRLKLGAGTGPLNMPWSAYAYAGPWGLCFAGTGLGTQCAPVLGNAPPGGKQAEMVTMASGAGQTFLVVALGPAASYLTVRFVGGRTVKVQPVTLGGIRFCVYRWRYGTPIDGWVAYSATGHALASVASLRP